MEKGSLSPSDCKHALLAVEFFVLFSFFSLCFFCSDFLSVVLLLFVVLFGVGGNSLSRCRERERGGRERERERARERERERERTSIIEAPG